MTLHDTAGHLRFKQAQPKMCHSPKVEDGVEKKFFTSRIHISGQFTFRHKFMNILSTLFFNSDFQQLFTESALRPIQSVSRDVRLFVCLCVRHTLETTLPEGLETSGRRAYR